MQEDYYGILQSDNSKTSFLVNKKISSRLKHCKLNVVYKETSSSKFQLELYSLLCSVWTIPPTHCVSIYRFLYFYFVSALNNGWLKEAYLDVFSVEPLPLGSGLWTHPRVTGQFQAFLA